jgi:hypothetical protein
MKERTIKDVYVEQIVVTSGPVDAEDIVAATQEHMVDGEDGDEICCETYDQVIGMMVQLRNREDHSSHGKIINGFKEVLSGILNNTTVDDGMFTQQGAETVQHNLADQYYG